MKVNVLKKDEFFDLVLNDRISFFEKINAPEVFIVKAFYEKDFVVSLRNSSFEWGQNEPDSWFPFNDECPDYHRLHDNYPKAYVKQKFHGFYRHNYVKSNTEIFNKMKDIFVLKNKLGNFKDDDFFYNIPSQGVLPRINVHHYPRGGGYQSEHIDPDGPFAKIQTLIVASDYDKDFKSGGVFARKELNGDKYYVDSYKKLEFVE